MHLKGPTLLALLALFGCAGGGGGCGSSCGGALVTKDKDGKPIAFTGSKLDNVAQVRITRSGLDFLNAQHLDDLLTALNGNAPGTLIPCTKITKYAFNACFLGVGTEYDGLFLGDANFNDQCDDGEGARAHIDFKEVNWGLDPKNQVLRASITAHVWTDPIYLRTIEAHSSLCGTTAPIQARFSYNDEPNDPVVTKRDTRIDLDLKLTPSPDGRMQINVSDSSLARIVEAFDASFINFDGFSNDAPCKADAECLAGWACSAATHRCTPPKGHYDHNACGSGGGDYNVDDGKGNLTCGGVFRIINGNCDPLDPDPKGLCRIWQSVRDYLLERLKTQFAPQIASLLRQQIDKARCQRSATADGAAHDCNGSNFRCGNDDNGAPLTCDASRGVCVPQGQSPLNPGAAGGTVPAPGGSGTVQVGEHNCEPIPLGITGQLDVATLTDKVGFPSGAGLMLTLGLGSKTGAAAVDANGVQLSAMAGTAPPRQNFVSVCVPPALFEAQPQPPALDFDGPDKPSEIGAGYDVGLGLASQMLNRALYDSYSAGLLCVAIDNKTTSYISSALFKTFLHSLGLVTGGRDVPMAVLLRPSRRPDVRIGKGSLKQNSDGTFSPEDALITLKFKEMNLDFYALIDERQVRLFTLQADLALPLGLRVLPDDSLQPVLGGLDTVLMNIKASNNEMLAEDPAVLKDLLGAVVNLARPLLAGILKPVRLPEVLGLKIRVKGITGAVASPDLANDGYQHLAVYAQIVECGPLSPCATSSVKTEARIAATSLPADAEQVRAGARPSVEIEAAALQTRRGADAEFSYRVDGGLWSPWLRGPRFTVKDAILLFPGRHQIEVIAREASDDYTQDRDPVSLDFFVSYDAPKVDLVQRNDGAIVTRAHSSAAPADKLLYSYRIGARGGWSAPGPARVFTADEVGGQNVYVSVSDEAGKAAVASLTADDKQALLMANAAGCSTSGSGSGAALLLAGLCAALWIRRYANGSSSRG